MKKEKLWECAKSQEFRFECACDILHDKGYEVEGIGVLNIRDDFDSYREVTMPFPMEFVSFVGFEYPPSVPEGFKMVYIMEKNICMMFYAYAIRMSTSALIEKRETVINSLFDWALSLPNKVTGEEI